MKNKGLIITLITILAILSISLLALMIFLINGNVKVPFINFSNKISEEFIFDENYENNFDKININSSSSDINIQKSKDNLVRVVIYGDEDLLTISDDSTELYISLENKKCFGFCFNVKQNKIEVYLPADYSKDIIINNNYGDIELAEFENSNIEINEDCGDVYIKNGNKIIVKNSYGDIKIDEAFDINIKEQAGDVKIGDVKFATIENNYGDITVESINGSLDINDDCGDIKIDEINLEKNSYITNNLGDIKIGSTNEIYIDAKTDLGSVKINNNYNKSDIILKLENDCGDIKVNN